MSASIENNWLQKTPDKEPMKAHFEKLLEVHGDNFRALDWDSAESQELRFSILMHLPIFTGRTRNFSLLDLGCGMGDLYKYLKKQTWLEKLNIKYTGVDIAPAMIKIAQEEFPEADFKIQDVFEEQNPETFDFIVSSGIFNTRVSDSPDYQIFVRKFIQKLYGLCRFGVAVNFQSTLVLAQIQVTEERIRESFKKYYYYDPAEMVEFAKDITRRFILRHDYHPADFTLFLIKNFGEG